MNTKTLFERLDRSFQGIERKTGLSSNFFAQVSYIICIAVSLYATTKTGLTGDEVADGFLRYASWSLTAVAALFASVITFTRNVVKGFIYYASHSKWGCEVKNYQRTDIASRPLWMIPLALVGLFIPGLEFLGIALIVLAIAITLSLVTPLTPDRMPQNLFGFQYELIGAAVKEDLEARYIPDHQVEYAFRDLGLMLPEGSKVRARYTKTSYYGY